MHANRATNIPEDIAHAGGTSSTTINQQGGGQWNLIGTYAFNAGSGGSVIVRTDGANGFVTADAVRFESIP